MPTKKVADTPKPCYDPDHNVPMFQVFEPGIYEHTCPSCGRVVRFTVDRPTLM